MKIGIMGAMPEETAGINDYFSKQPASRHTSEIRGNRVYDTYHLNDHSYTVVFSRWGKVASSSTATTLIDHFNVQHVIFTGVAGAVSSELNVGDIVVGDNYVQHDMDVSALPNMEKYQIPLTDMTYFPASPLLLDVALQSARATCEFINQTQGHPIKNFNPENIKYTQGTLASGDQFMTDKAHTTALEQEIRDLKTVDMESAAVAQVCYDYGIPFLAVRIVSDKAEDSSPIDFSEFIQSASSPMLSNFIEDFAKILKSALPQTT